MVRLLGINIIVKEDQPDSVFPQFAGIGDAVEQITGEPGDLLRNNQIESAVLTVPDHTIEAVALEGICPRDPLVNIDLIELPQRIAGDIIIEISLLAFE